MVKRAGCTHTLKHLGLVPLNMLSFVGAAIHGDWLCDYLSITSITVLVILHEISVQIHGMHVHLNGLHIHQSRSYNFARTPQVDSIEAFWDHKKNGQPLFKGEIEKIHMPNNSGVPFIMSCIFFVWGFSFVFSMWIPVIITTIGIFACHGSSFI